MRELIKTSNYVPKVTVVKESEKANIEFSKMEIPVELQHGYFKYRENETNEFYASLKPKNRIIDEREYIISELKEKSSLNYYVEYNKQEKVESENYLCVFFLSGRFETNKLVFKHLAKGIENLLLWEYECIKKYSTEKHAYQQYRIEYVSVIFEKEMKDSSIDEKILMLQSSLKHPKNLKLESSSENDKYIKPSVVNDSTFELIQNSSLFLNYLDDYTIDSIRKYLCNIKIAICFGADSYRHFYSKYIEGSLGLINFEIDFLKWTKKISANQDTNLQCLDYIINEITIEFPVDSSRCPELGLYMWDGKN